MKKVMIGLIIAAVVAGGGIFAINKRNQSLAQEYLLMENTIKVNQGNLAINVINSGNIELKDSKGDNLNELKLKIEVDELDINKIAIGQSAEVKVNAFPGEVFNGKVISIAEKGETANGVTTYAVEVSLSSIVNEIGKINTEGVGLRQGPASEYMTIKILDNGADVNILSKQGKWYEISLADGTTGWAYSDYITVGSIDKQDIEGTTVSEVVDVRKGPSTNYGITTKISKDSKVKIIDKDNNWYKVRLSNDEEGWVQGNDISIQKLKAGMSATASILIEEKKDALYIPVECVNKTDDGYVVILKGSTEYKPVKTGIVTDDYVEIIEGLSAEDEVKVLHYNNALDNNDYNDDSNGVG